MYSDLNNKQFDFVIFGTSITETILSAYLARCGKKILHIDISKYYGGDCKNFNYRDIDQCKFEFY
jgi:RAB protein geranylgeranyltransferase component A